MVNKKVIAGLVSAAVAFALGGCGPAETEVIQDVQESDGQVPMEEASSAPEETLPPTKEEKQEEPPIEGDDGANVLHGKFVEDESMMLTLYGPPPDPNGNLNW